MRERDRREVIRDEPLMHEPIRRELAGGPLTVPELAARLGRPPEEVLLWVMGMRRYRQVVEVPDSDEDGYFHYELAVTDEEVLA